jgi:uncharacterized Zn-binding protein involved in type VI secretion
MSKTRRAARLGDISGAAAAQGSPCISGGPAITGSANVLINERPALRVGDEGVNAICGHGHLWKAMVGAPRVLINDHLAHRQSDAAEHCNEMGKTLQGSSNVLIGDYIDDEQHHQYQLALRLFDIPGPGGIPLKQTRWRLLRDFEVIEVGETDSDGIAHISTTLHSDVAYKLCYRGRTIDIYGACEAPSSSIKGMKARLACLGYPPGHITSQFDEQAAHALREFQLDYELDSQAGYDKDTEAALVREVGF